MIILTQGSKLVDIGKTVENVSNGLKVTRLDDSVLIYSSSIALTQTPTKAIPETLDMTRMGDYTYVNGEFKDTTPKSTTISKFEFRQRMTLEEKVKLEMLDTILEGEILATVKAVLKDFDSAMEINLADPNIESFKNLMVNAGLLTKERVDEVTSI